MPLPKPSIIAHRGLHTAHPENSLAAFRLAWVSGLSWCECDTHLTADAKAVVIHDDTLDRTTSGRGSVAEMRWDQIKSLRLLDHHRTPTPERIPQLKDICRLIPANGGLLLEIKPMLPNPAVLLKEFKPRQTVILQSFHCENLHRLAAAKAPCKLALLIEDPVELAKAMDGPWHGVGVDQKLLTETQIQKFKDAGKSVGVWTVNDPDEILRFVRMGVDSIITDIPLEAQAIIARL